MIAVGEETGAMETMLGKIADFYDDEVDAAVDALTAMLEPIMMVLTVSAEAQSPDARMLPDSATPSCLLSAASSCWAAGERSLSGWVSFGLVLSPNDEIGEYEKIYD